jgi:hypothetical protein
LPARTPIERIVDQACGYTPTLGNAEGELQQFFEHCRDLLLMWPGLDDPRNFVQPAEARLRAAKPQFTEAQLDAAARLTPVHLFQGKDVEKPDIR